METTHYLTDILILLAAAIVAVPLFQRLGLGSVLGYLAAGAAVGPWGFGVIDEVDEIRRFAEFGVVFLLFIIGIELKPARLWAMRRTVFGLGTAQVMLTGLVIAGAAYLFGQPPEVAVIVGFGLALSSTAFGLQILNERGELNAGHGRIALSVLLLQDLAVVPLLALVSLLAAGTTPVRSIEFAVLQTILVIGVVVVVGRYLVSPILKLVATSRIAELFTAAAVFAVLGTAWLMETAGLSLALGAFLAGLVMSDSHYRHQVIADIEPFRSILLGLFFMGVGMSVDLGLLGREALLVVSLVIGLLIAKTSILWVLCRLMGMRTQDTTRASLLLSQSGEFGFVLFGLAAASGLFADETFRFLVLLIALTMATTPLMPIISERLVRYTGSITDAPGIDDALSGGAPPQVLIAGFGRVGRRIARLLQGADVPYLALENDVDRVLAGRRDGFSVYYGDASKVDLLRTAGAAEATAIVCTLNNPSPAVRMVTILRQHYPEVAIYARGHNRLHCDELLNAGATVAVSETLEASIQLGSEVLRSMNINEDDAVDLLESLRSRHDE